MSDIRTMVRAQVAIDGMSSFLAQGQDVRDLKRRIEAAAASPGRFVEFTVVGNRTVNVLITPRSEVAFSVETVQFDPRDTGDVRVPYGGPYDF